MDHRISRRVHRLTAVLTIVLALSGARATSAATVVLAWDPSPDTDVVGYVLQYGVQSGVYTSTIDVGLVTSASIDGLVAGQTYHCVVMAYDNTGLSSSPSNEVVVSVDAVTGADTTPPALVSVSPTNGASGVSTGTVVTASFNEPLDPTTIGTTTFELRDAFNTVVAATVSYDGVAMMAVLTPTASLFGLTTYTAIIHGGALDPRVKDLAGNPLSADATFSFTTGASGPSAGLTDTTVLDFTGGTPDSGISISQIADGEVGLAPAVGAEFSGDALPAGWSSTALDLGGTSTVGGGRVIVDGARVAADALQGPGRSIEFVATFGTDSDQGVGLATVDGGMFAVYGTYGGTLWARTHGFVYTDTPLSGSWIGTPHRFRIDWSGDAVVYFIDGAQVASHAISITASMGPVASDPTAGGSAVSVDWIHMTPYAPAGRFLSRIFDAGGSVSWANATWTSSIPGGTSLTVSVRSGDTPVPDATWSPFTVLPASGATVGASSRYLQYRADFATTVPELTPVLADITFTTTDARADTTSPSVTMLTPATGATVVGMVTVSASATDDVGVVVVQFLLDAAALGAEQTIAPYAVAWDTTKVANGSHTLSARA